MRLEQIIIRTQEQDSEPASQDQTVKERVEKATRVINAVKKRLKTAEQEVEALQKRTDDIDFEGYDTRVCQVGEDLQELDEKWDEISENMATQENLRDFGEDSRQGTNHGR
ncbi:hypothetical protein FPHYL_3014 [Fusarium phyllophilum]|uniref:Uncharacterized protein n=1 Tax=Fusarium phyllophilum TaxID=47803 RepID=A0A8H5NIM7_9HYPO|nr:hypothetical protein FPHYL_3014 [Fusarium phyllophilum]